MHRRVRQVPGAPLVLDGRPHGEQEWHETDGTGLFGAFPRRVQEPASRIELVDQKPAERDHGKKGQHIRVAAGEGDQRVIEVDHGQAHVGLAARYVDSTHRQLTDQRQLAVAALSEFVRPGRRGQRLARAAGQHGGHRRLHQQASRIRRLLPGHR